MTTNIFIIGGKILMIEGGDELWKNWTNITDLLIECMT